MFACSPALSQVKEENIVFFVLVFKNTLVKQLADVNKQQNICLLPKLPVFNKVFLFFFLFDSEKVLFQPYRKNENGNLSKCK